MNGSKKPDPFQQLSSSLASLNSSSPNQLQHSRNVARSPAASRIPNMPDAELKKFVESTEKMFADRSLLNALPDSGQKLRDNLEKAREELRKRESTPAFASADINEETTIESLPPKKVSPRLEEHVETSLVESMQSINVASYGGHMNEEVDEAPEPSDRSDQEHTRSSRSPNTTTNYMDKKSVVRDLLQRIPDTTKSLSTLQLRDTWRSESPSAASPPKQGPKAAKVLTIEEGCELAKQHELARKEAQERHAQYVLTSFAPKSSTASQPSDSFSRAYDFYNHREPDEDDLTESEEADAEEDIDEESEPDEKEE